MLIMYVEIKYFIYSNTYKYSAAWKFVNPLQHLWKCE